MRKLETFEWWSDLLELKDSLSLRQLAQRFDVTPGAISAALRRTNTGRMPAAPGPKPGLAPADASLPEAGERATPARPARSRAAPVQLAEVLGTVPRRSPAPGSAMPTGRDQAWQVVFRADGRDTIRVIVASNVVDAARAAAGAGTGEVVTLAWIGELL